jgi:hypothetical protein
MRRREVEEKNAKGKQGSEAGERRKLRLALGVRG